MADQIFNVECGFFDSVNNDRLYTADDMNRPYNRIFSNGIFPLPTGAKSSDFQVVSAGNKMNILVKPGQGMFANKWFQNPTNITITVPNNTAVRPRVDSVIIQIDLTTSGRAGNIVYRTGTPAANAAAPAINQVANVQEWRLANIYVAPSANTINNDAITDLRGKTNGTPWIASLFSSTFAISEMTSNYIATSDVTTVPINISDYDPNNDVLQVFINGLYAVEGQKYTINADGSSIELTSELQSGQSVTFVVFQSEYAEDYTVYRYMGTVQTYADLPTSGMVTGDVYTVETADPDNNIAAGDDVMWNGSEWEIMQTIITSAEIDSIINSIS